MQLNYLSYAPGNCEHPPIIIIPGLFGSTANWRSFAKKLAEQYHVVVIDQRNHGESPHADSHSYDDMVADLYDLCDHLNFDKVILCGHSMGGKVAMLFSLLHANRVAKLVVMDIAPVAYSHSHAPYLKALMQVDLSTLSSRSDAERALQKTIEDTPTRLFLMQSLVGKPGEYRWRLNLPVLLNDMPLITGFPCALVNNLSSDVDMMVLIGGSSDYFKQSHIAAVEKYFPKANFVTVEGAGHWLHAEKPKEVLNVLINFL